MLMSCIIYSLLPVLQFVLFVFFVANSVIVSPCHHIIISSDLVPLKSSEIETRIYIGCSPTYWPAQVFTIKNV